MNDENQKDSSVAEGLAKLAEIFELHLSNLSRTIDNEHRILALVEKINLRVDADAEEAARRDEVVTRNVNFIIQQQAQFTADMQQLREVQARSEQRWERTEESVRSLHAIAQIHEREVTALTESQARTDRQMAETDERINALVNVVERLVSDRK
jgi:hypothetical protein